MNNASNSGSQKQSNVQPHATPSTVTQVDEVVSRVLIASGYTLRSTNPFGRCAVCTEPYGNHSSSGHCPNSNNFGPFYLETTFKRYGRCEAERTDDMDVRMGKTCGSPWGTYRPEHERVYCDNCAEAIR